MHTLGLSLSQTYCPMWIFHFPPPLLFLSSVSLRPQEERRHPAAVRHRVPELRLRAVSQRDQQHHQVRTLPKVSAAAEAPVCIAVLPKPLNCPSKNPSSTALPHSAYRAAEREQNLITARTKVTQRPRCI